jgi:hypothetical protein
MRISRIGQWHERGLLGVLAIHIAVFFIFVLIVSFASLSVEERFVSWIGSASEIQIVTTLVVVLSVYVAVEIGLFYLLMRRYLKVLEEGWAQREWIAYVILTSMLIATLTSPLAFGSFALVLPGLPELIVFFSFPYVTKAIKARA